MKCPNCQFENPEGHRFCGRCGHELGALQPIADARPPLEGERKRVTALFSDLSGYTAMTSKLDPEEVKEITSRVFDGVREVVSKYEGFIERFAGDGVLALFGVPKAHEDDPIRAVHAAREIHELIESLSPRYEVKIGGTLSMHSGVNTGLAVTADVNPEKGTHGVTGDAINVAARLSDLAQAREILVGPDTHRACQSHFSFQPLAPARVKGKSEPLLVFKVLSAKVSAPQARTGRQVSSEMVGRDSELDKLELQVMKAINGEGSVVNVIGEAGIGKSRLIAELKQRDVMKRVTLLEGRAISIGKNLSFHPIIDLLKQWARIAEEDSERTAFEKLERAIRAVHPEETDEILAFVATLMGMKLTGKYAERVKGIEGEGLEKLILKNLRDLVIKGSELRPTVIIMEDLHWADTSSIELLGSLYRLAERHRVAFINVFRPGYFDSHEGPVAKIGEPVPVYYVEIEIQPLHKNDCETLINNMLEIKGLPYSLKTQIVERAGGNPFFIEEVVRSLIDEGAVVRLNGGFEVTDKIEKVVIPPTINDVLIARIDRLEEQTRELVKVASVIGRSFFDRIIKEVADSIEDVDDRLAYLKNIQLIRERTRMQELEYLFKHALAQEAAYESTLLQQRKALHLKVAQSIENIFRERLGEFYGMLAYHYSKADNLDKAEEYLTKAGEEALRSSASSEALSYFQESLRLYLDTYGDDADSEKLATFEGSIALAFYNKGQWANAVMYFDRMLERKGFFSPRNKLIIAIKLTYDVIIVATQLYLAWNKGGRAPLKRDEELLDFAVKRGEALVFVDSNRFFTDYVGLLRKSCRYDITKTPTVARLWTDMGGVLSYLGVWFKLSKRILERTKETITKNSIGHKMSYVTMDALIHHCSGTWSTEQDFDGPLVDSALKQGKLWHVINYMWFSCLTRNEQGEFKVVKMLLEKLLGIGATYDYEGARVFHRSLRCFFLTKVRRLHAAQIEAEAGISYTKQWALDLQQFMFLGQKAQIYLFLKDIKEAVTIISEAKRVIPRQMLITPLFACQYLVARFLIDINLLEKTIASNNHADLSVLRKSAYRSGKAAMKNARKYAPFRTWILRLMGHYYWLVGRQSKAMKWWDSTIKEGERLGARPDLSRTYFEVGKHLLKPDSKYKQLNGIEANGYLEKAGILFEEMGLERDLEDLERVRIGL